MNPEARSAHVTTSPYIVAVMTVTGVCAAVFSVLIAWPALSYIGAKLI